jgi:hypothetical protein
MAYNQPTGSMGTLPSKTASYNDWMKTMKGAETTLTGAANAFAPGGSYGAGANAIIQGQSQQAQASALSNLVSTGMSSGTNALGAKARISADATKARLSVADERSKMYANVLTQLAGLKQNMAGGQLNWAELNQRGNIANEQMNLQKWLTTTNNAMRMPQDQGAGGGLPAFNTGGYNPWGPTTKGDPNYNLEEGNTGSTGMTPSV